MRAARLKYLCVLLTPSDSKNELGSPTQEFKPFIDEKIPCDIQSIRENESFVSSNVKTNSELKFVIRYMKGVNTSMRVDFDGKTYKILDVIDPFMRKKELRLFAKVVS